ncbi:putative START domain-containing protein [Helianthus annuus]|uniref:Putative START domain, START-like domain protein n=1 Tax=Helianthus annuus TaxID=4232 RepID=A0A251RXB6_HELAN|nr:putative START domain, class III homeodomain-leucine zipper family [Helianthus annuus]KAJ0441372.1 putative START domain-containing protein [Helianthus annuus]KAJ0459343.1 putative START domain, class III homeodomain-leucine zipper family [Helianthus annuus]KAJ0643835.1 putative START domain, class III homeodomain-leucine zipper family [Helianthus annuus]KAJ0834575.1 putative START domain-containing protein [Helianthus annuus]
MDLKSLSMVSPREGKAISFIKEEVMPGPASVGIFTISQSCSGVAARACGLVSLEPTKILEILKDRPSWHHDCWNLEVFTTFPAGNGGTIKLVYTQIFAPTTLAPARDFWTLRYPTSLENGSLVIQTVKTTTWAPTSSVVSITTTKRIHVPSTS